MSQLKILDTGYVNATLSLASQTQIGDGDRAGYTGSAISSFTLPSNSSSLNGGVSIESKSIIGSNSDPSTSLISVNRRVYPISFILKKDIVTAGWDVNNVVQLSRLDRTQGMKLLYPASTGDILPNVVEAMGAVNIGGNFSDASPTDDKGTVSTTTPYLVGRVKNFSVRDDQSGNYWRVSFDFEVSG